MLQNLMGYPVMTTGLVTAPSGLGTMCTMMLAGRLVGRMDSRLILAMGFGLTAFSLWQMSGYTPQLSEWDIVWPGFIQGMRSEEHTSELQSLMRISYAVFCLKK